MTLPGGQNLRWPPKFRFFLNFSEPIIISQYYKYTKYQTGDFTPGYQISEEKIEKQKSYEGLKFQNFCVQSVVSPIFREMVNFRSNFTITLLFINCFKKSYQIVQVEASS